MAKEDESFLEAAQRLKRGQRGKSAEDQVHVLLSKLKNECLQFDFERLPDSRAAGRPLPPTVSDYTGVYRGRAIAIEVKEVATGMKLSYSKFEQYSRMKRRYKAGALCLLIIWFREHKLWHVAPVHMLNSPEGRGSWDFSKCKGWSKLNIKEILEELWQK